MILNNEGALIHAIVEDGEKGTTLETFIKAKGLIYFILVITIPQSELSSNCQK